MYVSGIFTLNGTTSLKDNVQSKVGQPGRLNVVAGMPMQIAFFDGDILVSSNVCSVKCKAFSRVVTITTQSGTEYRLVAA